MKFTGERYIVGQAVGDIEVEHLQRYKAVSTLVKNKIVLDAACGEGYGSYILSQCALNVTGIDISEQAISYAKQRYNHENLNYRCASIEKLPFLDHSIDVVISFETIEHVNVELQGKFLVEIKRVLKPDGIMIMSSPDKRVYSDIRNFNNPYHVNEMYIDQFKGVLEGCFTCLSFFSQGIDNKRLGVIERLDGKSLDTVRLVNKININPDEMQYIIAVCSDCMLDDTIVNQIVSIMPFTSEIPTRLFVDFGHGFKEEDVLVGELRQEGNEFFVKFDFTNVRNVKKIRFDPVEHSGCICKIEQMNSDAKNIVIKALNAFDVDEQGERFLNTDPQYLIDGDFCDITYLDIQYNFSAIDQGELCELLQIEYNYEHEHKLAEIVKRDNEIVKRDNEIVKRDNEIVKRDNEIVKVLAEKVDLENRLREIYSSRGYCMLQKYYKLRDIYLPRASMRRLLVKNIIRGITNYKKKVGLVNKGNLSKVWYDIKRGNFRNLFLEIDNKMSSSEVNSFFTEEKMVYINDWVIKNQIINGSEVDIDIDIDIDIVIPIYNAYSFTKKCIEAVYKNTDIRYNLFLINDCSTDGNIDGLLSSLDQVDRPSGMISLNIIKNDINLGFIGSVNKGIDMGRNHVVLLNTDTEVPQGWLSRLAYPIINDNKIASVTPFSNCATICSFPNFCEDNEVPFGVNVDQMDRVFDCYGGGGVIDVPTGVGFCMILNRTCIDEFGAFDTVYGKGYGEENDWCMRAYKKGYRNVMITNLFVYHKHGVSFAEHTDKAKSERIQENLNLLVERYPEYLALVDSFISRDILKKKREFLYSLVLARQSDIEGVLLINHSMGGGTKVYQDNLIRLWREKKRAYTIELQLDYCTLVLTDDTLSEQKMFYLDLNALTENVFKGLLQAFNIKLIYINHLVTYPIDKMINLITQSGIEYIYFAHDYYLVCPSYNLMNNHDEYCYANIETEQCRACLKKLDISFDVIEWREKFSKFLVGAKQVTAPSLDTVNIINKYYPEIIVDVKEHDLSKNIYRTFDKSFVEDDFLKIALIGAISEVKGSKILYELVQRVKDELLPIKIVVIGITNSQNKPYKSDDGFFEITGSYDNSEVSDLLAKYRIGGVLIPSIGPETYSYTTSEAMYSGYPIIAFDIGAPAERIKRYGCGWVLDKINCDEVLLLLKEIVVNRSMLLNKSYYKEEV